MRLRLADRGLLMEGQLPAVVAVHVHARDRRFVEIVVPRGVGSVGERNHVAAYRDRRHVLHLDRGPRWGRLDRRDRLLLVQHPEAEDADAVLSLAALSDAGLPPRRASQAWAALIGLTNGHVMYELNGHLDARPGEHPSVDPDIYPSVARSMSGERFDWGRGFVIALRDHIESLSPDQGRT